jgi:hypothetical protein
MSIQPAPSDPNISRLNALMLFYAAAMLSGAAASIAEIALRHGTQHVSIPAVALAALAALIAIVALMRFLRTADELQRRINH